MPTHEEMIESAYADLEKVIRENTQIRDLARIREAYMCARSAHAGQLRKEGTPFVTHPIAAAKIVAEMGLDEESIIAALLHDTVEDTAVTHEDIARHFGESVAELVEGVTKLTRVTYTSKEDEQMSNLRKMLMAMAKDIRVIIIKMADRLHNMRTMEYQTEEKQREKALETMEIYTPIAHRLGMQRMKWELEDLSLKYLDPVGYSEIKTALESRGGSHVRFMANTEALIKRRLEEAGIRATVQSRIKHIYSIYRKMYGQDKELSEVMDLYAFRVIVEDISDCYNVLGMIHEIFRPIPGHFKDYIGTPKPNKYQSLHTTVIGTEGIPFEVQIRTWDMHHTAEYGIAAHWKYKEGIRGKADEEKFEWIRSLLEAQQDSDAQDFVQTLKVDMFADEVFVFTPHGDVKSLPAGSTPIDFAYSVHSAVGNRMTGARVNGRIVPFSHVLQNGDVVEIMTSNTAKGPSRDWLTIVKSSEARTKIRQWFKKEKREENIGNGRAAFEAELRRLGVSLSVMEDESVVSVILKRFSFSSIDDMYAAIGYGALTALKTATRVRDELRQIEKFREQEGKRLEWRDRPEGASRPIHGIIVEGVDNCLVKFARCCTPVPGDDIVGFITRGYGVSVHRADCVNYQKAAADEAEKSRWIKVYWESNGDDLYQTVLAITAEDRGGLVMDIATVLNALKVSVNALIARNVAPGAATVFITISVHDRDELSVAMARLTAVRGVKDVKRQNG